MTAAASAEIEPVRPSERHGSRRRIRLDIQALRALAVGLVVVYHLRSEWLSGGFIGVDVFFVISGFLITSYLIREAACSGRVRLGAFWAARARRILPASLVTIGATIALTIWLPPVTLFEGPRDSALRGTNLLHEAVALEPRVSVADFTDLFCDTERCNAVIGNAMVYRDYHHITAMYARTMMPRLTEALSDQLPD